MLPCRCAADGFAGLLGLLDGHVLAIGVRSDYSDGPCLVSHLAIGP